MALMHDYAELINELRPTAEQFTEIEQYWVKRIQAFFTSKPFKLESDNSLSVDAAVEHLLRQAAQRRRENPGTMYVGTVLQHLVAAKLTIVAPEVEINGASVADDPSPRLPTVRPRTVSQNRPRLRPPVSSQLTTPTGSGASSRKRHCDAPYTRRRHCPVPPGTGRSAPLRCRAVRHPICHVSDRSRIWRRRIDARCAERQRSRRWRATAGWLPAAGHPAAARQASLPRIASDRSRPDRSRGNTPPPSPYVLRVIAAMPSSSHSSASSPAYEASTCTCGPATVTSPSLSMTRSSQSKSQWSSMGWRRSQLKMARATVLTPAWPIRRMSSSQISSGHWSGL